MRILIGVLAWLSVAFGGAFSLDDLLHIERDRIGGEWIQNKQLIAFENTIKSSGKFKIIDKELFWESTSPIESEMKLNEKHMYIKQNNQWIIANRQYDKDIFLDIINLNFENIKKNFNLQLSGSSQQWSIELKPKSVILQKIFRSIFISGGRHVQMMVLTESNGDITTTTFHNVSKLHDK